MTTGATLGKPTDEEAAGRPAALAASGQDRDGSARPLRIVLADDNPVVRTGLANLLATVPGFEVVGTAADGAQALEMITRLGPDVAVLDVRMPSMDGIAVTQAVSDQIAVLVLTHSDEPEVVAAVLAAGARGYVAHQEFALDAVVNAIRSVADGAGYLSPSAVQAVTRAAAHAAGAGTGSSRSSCGLSAREVEIMDLVAEGLSNRDIARRCFLAEKTVKNHVNRIFAKLAVTSRAEAVSRWLRT